MQLGLAGKVALVTGGTRGLGRSIATALSEQGCYVVACARNAPEPPPEPPSAPSAPSECEPLSESIDGVSYRQLDLRKAEDVAKMVDSIVEEKGRLDIIVNNAGGSPVSEAATASSRFADAVVHLNLLAPYYVARAAHPHLMRSGGGVIINIASVSGIRPSPGTALYGAAKAGLLNLTQSLAQEWGKDKIRVNAIIVGLAETEKAAQTYGDQAVREKIAASLPLGRMCSGKDVADAVLYLASPLAAYVSGARLNVDGGGERPYFLELVKGD